MTEQAQGGLTQAEIEELVLLLTEPSITLDITAEEKAELVPLYQQNLAALADTDNYAAINAASVITGYAAALASAVQADLLSFETADAITAAAAHVSRDLVESAKAAA